MGRDTNSSKSTPEKAAEWVTSKDGQARIREAMESAEQSVAGLRAARRLDPDLLKHPVTV